MSTTVQTDQTVALSCGAISILYQLLQSAGWTKLPKEKHASGKIQVTIEEVIISQPDPVLLPDNDPGYQAADLARRLAMREWDRKAAPNLILTDLKFQTVQSCLKYFTAQESVGSNRFLAELQEAFRVVE